MSRIQLYIQGQRVDVFSNETIEVKSSIQDAKDISKVFTDFSKPFNVPASQRNNKIFKHFYNHEISDGFDARVQIPAEIYIDYQLFRKGKIYLEGVDMKSKVAHTYKLIFFGNTVSLKDLFKDEKLSSLDLTAFDHTFDLSTVKGIFNGNGFLVDGDTESLIYPLITSKRRLFYDSNISDTAESNYDGNLYRSSDVDHNLARGVSEVDLKPAIKAYHIIKAIEQKYGINLIPNDTPGTKDFFSKHNPAFSNLYLWISNNSGNITDRTDGDNYFYRAEPKTFTEHSSHNTDLLWFYESEGRFVVRTVYTDNVKYKRGDPDNDVLADFRIKIRPSAIYDEVNWRLNVRDFNTKDIVFSSEGSGDQDVMLDMPSSRDYDQSFYIEFQSEESMQYTEIIWEARKINTNIFQSNDHEVYTTGETVDTNSKELAISNNIPDMKVIEFISGFMKMFNLTAYYIDDETDPEYSETTPVVKVTTLDDFYGDAINNQSNGIIDVTEYIDIKSHIVNTSLPFSEIKFKYEDNDTVIRDNHYEMAGKEFGNSEVVLEDRYRKLFLGEPYEVKLPFTILKYEHLRDYDRTTTDIQWGYAAGGDFSTVDGDYSDSNDILAPRGDYKSEKIKPLLFYGIKVTNSHAINFRNDVGTSSQGLTTYYKPSNINEEVSPNSDGIFDTPAPYQITFNGEVDEFSGAQQYNSLYEVFYKNYIESVFDKDKRMFVFNAYFPPKILTVLKLNDQLKIQDVVYRINSIVTSLITGKTKLELINLDHEEIVE
jgi:hypothetical protein